MTNRLQVLDGWRGISILLVLAGHLFPLGPKLWQLNGSIASSGMAIFFILSGFLITSILLKDQNILHFLIRRFLRIVPLAWLAILITLLVTAAPLNIYLPHFLFYANWPPMSLIKPTGHLWRLCVEVQFYILIALLIATFKQRTFVILPLLCAAITAYRFFNHTEIAINTYYRLDEILAGCILAIVYHRPAGRLTGFISRLNPIYLFPLLMISAHPEGGLINYARPYIALLMVGSSLFVSQTYSNDNTWYQQCLKSRFLFYIASISYALYVIHGGLMDSWLGEGGKLEKYLKRPLLLFITFGLAHLSTFYYEKYWISLGKKITKKTDKSSPV